MKGKGLFQRAGSAWGTWANAPTIIVTTRPPVGTPSTCTDTGNSTRMRVLVAVKTKSERTSERRGQK